MLLQGYNEFSLLSLSCSDYLSLPSVSWARRNVLATCFAGLDGAPMLRVTPACLLRSASVLCGSLHGAGPFAMLGPACLGNVPIVCRHALSTGGHPDQEQASGRQCCISHHASRVIFPPFILVACSPSCSQVGIQIKNRLKDENVALSLPSQVSFVQSCSAEVGWVFASLHGSAPWRSPCLPRRRLDFRRPLQAGVQLPLARTAAPDVACLPDRVLLAAPTCSAEMIVTLP